MKILLYLVVNLVRVLIRYKIKVKSSVKLKKKDVREKTNKFVNKQFDVSRVIIKICLSPGKSNFLRGKRNFQVSGGLARSITYFWKATLLELCTVTR